jgi:hypothetical protein
MPSTPSEKKYQNTTVRLPRRVYELAKTVINRSQGSSFNEFVVQAIEEKVRRLTEAEIDAAFALMAQDTDYQRESTAMAREFEMSDWEALQSTESASDRKARASNDVHVGTSKARSR